MKLSIKSILYLTTKGDPILHNTIVMILPMVINMLKIRFMHRILLFTQLLTIVITKLNFTTLNIS